MLLFRLIFKQWDAHRPGAYIYTDVAENRSEKTSALNQTFAPTGGGGGPQAAAAYDPPQMLLKLKADILDDPLTFQLL